MFCTRTSTNLSQQQDSINKGILITKSYQHQLISLREDSKITGERLTSSLKSYDINFKFYSFKLTVFL